MNIRRTLAPRPLREPIPRTHPMSLSSESYPTNLSNEPILRTYPTNLSKEPIPRTYPTNLSNEPIQRTYATKDANCRGRSLEPMAGLLGAGVAGCCCWAAAGLRSLLGSQLSRTGLWDPSHLDILFVTLGTSWESQLSRTGL